MRTRRCLRMTLKAECWLIRPRQALQRAVKQTDVGSAQVAWQAFVINCKAVVLAGDADTPVVKVFDRVVRAVVALLHFESFGTCG